MIRILTICAILLFSGFTNSKALCNDRRIASAHNRYDSAVQQRSMHKIISACIALGDAYKGYKMDSAYLNYAIALKLANRFSIETPRSDIFYELAKLQYQVGNYKDAIVLFDSSRKSGMRQGNYSKVSSSMNMLGTLQMDIWNFTEAKKIFEEAYQLALINNLNREAGVALGNLSRFAENIDTAITVMKKAIRMIKAGVGERNEIGYIYINIGNRMSHPDSALKYYEQAVFVGQLGNDNFMLIQAWNNMAYSFLEKNMAGKADQLIGDSAIPTALADSNFEWLATLYDTWSDVKGAQHDYPGAWKMGKKAMKYRSMAEIKKSTDQVRFLIILLDLKNKDLLISSSKLKLDQQESSIRNLRFILFILFVSILTIALVGYGLSQRNKIRMQRKELELTKKQIEIEDSERTRLSMQLHDLTGVLDQKMINHIEKLSLPDQTLKSELIAEWKKTSMLIHNISYWLNKSMIESLPFNSLIDNILEEYQQFSDLSIKFEISQAINFPAKQQYQLFSIIQELMNNAVKHVRRGAVTFKFSFEYGNYYLIYEDDGPGFNQNSHGKKKMGIQNIFDRAVIVGGKATLTTSPGKGTKWIIAVPQIRETDEEKPG
jgi:signal transduction histidine kinase